MIASVELAAALTTSRTLVRRLLGELVGASHSASLEKAESPSIVLLASLIVKNNPQLGPIAARQAMVPRHQLAPSGSPEGVVAKPAPGLSRRELLKRLDEVEPQQLVDYVLRQNHVSARTRYNLACYYTTLAELGGDETRRGCLELALKSLERSLEGGGLTEWAGKDPSLGPLRTALPKRFAAAVADHAVSPHTAPSVAAADEDGEEAETEVDSEQIDPVPLLADLLASAGPEGEIVVGGSERGFHYAVRSPERDVLVVVAEKPDWTQTEALFDAAEDWEGIVPRLVIAVPGKIKVPAPIVREDLTIEVLPLGGEG